MPALCQQIHVAPKSPVLNGFLPKELLPTKNQYKELWFRKPSTPEGNRFSQSFLTPYYYSGVDHPISEMGAYEKKLLRWVNSSFREFLISENLLSGSFFSNQVLFNWYPNGNYTMS